jgi:hypothetical protein
MSLHFCTSSSFVIISSFKMTVSVQSEVTWYVNVMLRLKQFDLSLYLVETADW